jgi:hypothetical protein
MLLVQIKDQLPAALVTRHWFGFDTIANRGTVQHGMTDVLLLHSHHVFSIEYDKQFMLLYF